jgi:EAL domain-containing protein (putative c-di-GMP-specific phosphodiesterase class I)
MYRAKSRGKARYELFTQRLHTRAVELLQLETDLRHAVERDELVLHYQPIVDLTTGAIASCEALIRWNHPTKGLVPPSEFIGVAEESGAIVAITRWVLETACRQRRAWIEAGLPAIRVSVNISPRQLLQHDISNLVTDTLAAFGQPPEALQLELTESALMESSEATVAPLKELYARGVRISLDDFGTGYSSLIYLRRFPIHNIKIDQSFVRSIPRDEGNSAIASGLIALAHSLNLRVVAEGVETVEQLRFLRDKSCDEIQGYVVSRPAPADEFALIMENHADLNADDPSLILRRQQTAP